MPSYVNVNMGAEQKSVEIFNLCIDDMRGECRRVHRWLFTSDMIRSYRYVDTQKCLRVSILVMRKKYRCLRVSILFEYP